ncbi:MAG: TolC family protein [Ignavibacteria bacterium]|nr:TolC family protein [Ignavibacteria bacterium]
MKHIIYIIFLIFIVKNISAQDNLPQYLSLSAAEKIAKENNPVLKKGANRILSAKGRYFSGISPQMPELSLSYDFVPIGSGLQNYEERSIELNQAIEFPLKTIYRGEQLNSAIDLVKSENEIEYLNVISGVRKAYIEVQEKQVLIKLAEENLITAGEFKEKSGIRYNAGEATNLEKLTAEVQYTQAKNNLEILKNNYKIALSDLLYSMGIKEALKIYNPVITDTLTFLSFDESLESTMERTMNTNPLIRLAEHKTYYSQINKKAALSSYLPDFSIGYKRQSVNGINSYYGINFGISIPLWFVFEQRGKVEEANAEIKISENEYDETYNFIRNSVKKAYENQKNSEKQILLYKNTLIPESEEIHRIANAGYQTGEITYLEYLQAKQILVTTKESYISALKEYNLNLIELEKAIGRKLF